jgi:hypothetical protein
MELIFTDRRQFRVKQSPYFLVENTMKRRTQSGFTPKLFTILLAGLLLLSACAPVVEITAPPLPLATSEPTLAPQPTATSAPTATTAPTAVTVSTPDTSLHFTLDSGSLSTGLLTETVPGQSASDNGPYWDLLPEYTRVTLQGYPIKNHILKAQIFIYPLKDLGTVNEGAGKIAAALQALLKSPQEIANMPFMPLFNASQVLHVHVKYLDFKSGQGVRFLTQFDQAFIPINNSELFYTYQGLSRDGKYYVAAVLPVNHPDLPADGKVTGNEPPEFTSDFPAYLANRVKTLNTQADNTFTPDLTQLDAMLSSLEIK